MHVSEIIRTSCSFFQYTCTYILVYMCSYSIPNLDSSCSPLVLPVEGQSLMPYCHFDLEQSDYLSQREGGAVFTASGATTIDHTSTRVIEFGSCGVGVKNIKYVVSQNILAGFTYVCLFCTPVTLFLIALLVYVFVPTCTCI